MAAIKEEYVKMVVVSIKIKLKSAGVADGARTRNPKVHNLVLYH